MAETKWTKGDWYVAGTDLVMADDVTKQETSLAIEISCDASEQKANAHLIAASPTMAAYIKRKADEGDREALEIWEIATNAKSK